MINKIAYLAPEIPSVSATFVYKEIIAIQTKGVEIIPISVHRPKVVVVDPKVKELSKNTRYLYDQNIILLLINSIILFFNKPKPYLVTLFKVFIDIFDAGLTKFDSFKLLYHFLQASNVARIIEKNSCQHLHIHFAHVPTQIGMYASLITKIPFSFTSHANDLFERNLLLKKKVDRAKAAVTISAYNYKFLTDRQVDNTKLQVVKCGIDSHKYKFINKENLSKPLTIGSLGRLVEKKGMDDLILALSKLSKKGIDFSLEIGGDGYLSDRLKQLVTTHNLNSKIKFKGVIPNEDVYSWLKTLDIFILACKEDSKGDKDGIPVVLMEAMAIGIPVISTEISGIPELIQDGVSGFLAKPNDPNSLADSIDKLLHWPQPISQITRVARQKIIEEFEQKANAERLLSIFNN